MGGSCGNENLTRVKFKDGVTRTEGRGYQRGLRTKRWHTLSAARDPGYNGVGDVWGLRGGCWILRREKKNTVGRSFAGFLRPWEHATGTRQCGDDPSCLSSVLLPQGRSSMKDRSVIERERERERERVSVAHVMPSRDWCNVYKKTKNSGVLSNEKKTWLRVLMLALLSTLSLPLQSEFNWNPSRQNEPLEEEISLWERLMPTLMKIRHWVLK